MSQFVNLHSHSYYSLIDGLPNPEEYLKRAKELGMSHLTTTEHGTLSSHRHFQRVTKDSGVKPILGMEGFYTIDPADRRPRKEREPWNYIYNHLTILAKDAIGLQTLGRLSEKAYAYGFYERPRIGKEWLFNDHEGLIILSGCMSGVIAKAIERNEFDSALKHAQQWKETFGDDFYIEVMSSNEPELNLNLLKVADSVGIPAVMTQDCHYANKEDLWAEEAMLILATGPKPAKGIDFAKSQTMEVLDRFDYLYPERQMTFRQIEIYMRDYETEQAKFAEQGITRQDIFENTLVIADKIGEYPYHENLDLLPRINSEPEKLLRDKVAQGLKVRGLDKNVEALGRVAEELDTICDMGFASYFLIVDDIVREAKFKGIRMSPGRGSVAACLSAYAMGIHQINPLDYNLLFMRFLDKSRSESPDIDIDLAGSRRYEIKDYLRTKYDNVASIATFGYFKDKGIIRDAARVFRIPLGDVNKSLKKISTFEEFESSPETKWFRDKYPEVLKLARVLRGRIRSQGVHAGGIVLSNQPLSNHAPMQSGVDPDNKLGPRIPVVAYDKHEVEKIGLIKFDILGLKALDIVESCIQLINRRTGKYIDLDALPLDDSNVYNMLSQGFTRGVFQAEQVASTRLIVEMGVTNFNELAASNALVRPGASKSSFGKNYLLGKKTGRVKYIHDDVKWFTEETFGQIVYQEQILFLCTDLAGMTMEEGNQLRSAVAKKIPEKLAVWKDIFIEGASSKIGETKARKLWKDLEAAGEYSFNKSHAVAYSLLTYQMAWLKHYYPLEFMISALTHRTDKDDRLDLLMEAKRMGLRIVLPHVNHSDISFSIQSDTKGEFIRIGLVDIKYIGQASAAKLIKNRPFGSYQELKDLTGEKYSGVNIRMLEYMNKIGAALFDDNPLKGDERSNFYEVLSIPAFEVKDLPVQVKAMLTPLEDYDEQSAFFCMGMVRDVVRKAGWARIDIVDETGKAGIFIDPETQIEAGNMYVLLVSNNRVLRYIMPADLDGAIKDYLEESIDISPDEYKVINLKTRKTKAGNNMANVVFADYQKNLIPGVIFNSNFFEVLPKLDEGNIVRVDLDGDIVRRVYV